MGPSVTGLSAVLSRPEPKVRYYGGSTSAETKTTEPQQNPGLLRTLAASCKYDPTRLNLNAQTPGLQSDYQVAQGTSQMQANKTGNF